MAFGYEHRSSSNAKADPIIRAFRFARVAWCLVHFQFCESGACLPQRADSNEQVPITLLHFRLPSPTILFMSHAHVHGDLAGRRLAVSAGLMLIFVVGETVAGLLGHSLALLSDAGHNFADVLALLLSWYGVRAASWPSHSKRTFGYHRVGILAALMNAASLVVIAFFILWEAADRIRHPEQNPSGKVMMVVAAFAVVINGIVAMSLHGSAKDDLNVRMPTSTCSATPSRRWEL